LKKGACSLYRLKLRMLLVVLLSLFTISVWPAEKNKPQGITVRVVAAPPQTSEEGFIEETNIWRLDSAKDFTKAINKKCWHPKDKTKKANPDLATVCFSTVDSGEDVTIVIAGRGENAQSLGQRTTMRYYKGVAIADTVPTVGVTRWVSVILTIGTYKKEFVAWSTNTARWSLGAWSQDANLLAQNVMDWCLLNQAKLRK
jgi:hypothetical protein